MPNALATATSPYLLQHAHNPVQWQPWGETALAQARAENKLLLVSIGYSACHWCHVMERESFEDEGVAAVMNQHYICIKVDREERPDVDQIYMDAVQLMQGHGGWPLNCLCLPDGRPLFGGTYFPKARWLEVLRGVAHLWQQDPQKAETYAAELTEALQRLDVLAPNPQPALALADLDRCYLQIGQRLDLYNGGVGQAPKFPVPSTWRFLLIYGHDRQAPQALEALHLTLRKMAWGGIYDHLGGGFARYATDSLWRVPHFEKMLYDNAQLIGLYALAYRQAQEPLYAEVVRQSIAFGVRELMSPEGGFYSALDADSEGVEGRFYTWPSAEIDRLLGPAAGLFRATYNVVPEGNWEHTNILFRTQEDSVLADSLGIPEEQFRNQLAEAREVLLQARAQRPYPGRDDKILSGWNSLMTAALCEAYLALGEPAYRALALRNQDFLEQHLAQGPALLRTAKRLPDGSYTTAFAAYLEDYAANLQALLLLYSCTFDQTYLHRAATRLEYVLHQFSDPDSPLLFFTAATDAPLIARRKETTDSVLPSSNASMAHSLRSLGTLLGQEAWVKRSEDMLRALWPHIERYPASYAHWCELAHRQLGEEPQIVVAGPKAMEMTLRLAQRYWGAGLLMGSADGKGSLPLLENRYRAPETYVYVCRNKTCLLPVAIPEDAWEQLGC